MGWGTTSFEVVLTRELEALAIVMGCGGRGGVSKFPSSKFPSFKIVLGGRGANKFLFCLELGGGGEKSF